MATCKGYPEGGWFMASTMGILPAAGAGSRLGSFAGAKELLPVRYQWSATRGELAPTFVIQHSLAEMAHAGIPECLIIISKAKLEIVRVLGAGLPPSPHLAYVVQPEPAGLVDAILRTYSILATAGCDACLTLPDTVFEPAGATKTVLHALRAQEADLMLGVFPTDVPETLGPVGVRPDGTVTYVLDKPKHAVIANTWGVAAWTAEFFEFLFRTSAAAPGDLALGELFNLACREGLRVRAVTFETGKYHDLGTPQGVSRLFAELNAAAPSIERSVGYPMPSLACPRTESSILAAGRLEDTAPSAK